MVQEFEDYTFPLTDLEENEIVPMIVELLSERVGKSKAITNKDIRFALNIEELQPVRIRIMISYIRIRGLLPLLLACGNGYYVSNDREEIDTYIESLDQRVSKIEFLIKQLLYERNQLRIKNEKSGV